MKEMDMDVTEWKKLTYISPRKHGGEHPVGLDGLREAEVPARETKAVWEGAQKEALSQVLHPAVNPHHLYRLKYT